MVPFFGKSQSVYVFDLLAQTALANHWRIVGFVNGIRTSPGKELVLVTAALITYERHDGDLVARKVLYKRSESSSMLLVMRRRHISWLLALLALAGSLVLTSCMNQEGIGPGSGELKDRPGSTG